MDKQEEARQQALQESLKRGATFEELIRSNGWAYIKAWYTNKIQQFATQLLIEDKKSIGEFENERRELIGLRKMMGSIDNDIKVYREEQEKSKKK